MVKLRKLISGSHVLKSATQRVVLFGAVLVLAACSSSAPAGVLTQSDMPSYLGVRADQSAFTLRDVRTAPCKEANGVVFDGSWKHLKAGPSSIPVVTSIAFTCASVPQAHEYLNTIKLGAKTYPISGIEGHPVPGVGDEAWFIDAGRQADLRSYTLGWRQGDRVGLVQVEAPLSDKRVTPALVELLARRAAARS
jgi:hypothetical protein